MCNCAGCMGLEGLTLKFVAHAGEVAIHGPTGRHCPSTTRRVRGREEIAGVDVILVHRLLKNAVPIREYLLMATPILAALPPAARDDLEGLGETEVHWVDTVAFADVPAPPQLTWWQKLLRKVAMELSALPWLLGLRRRRLRQLDA